MPRLLHHRLDPSSRLARLMFAEYGVAVDRIESGTEAATLHAADGRTLTAPLVVVADGGRGDQAPPPRFERDYDQMAVVCDVKTELPHANQAFERFTPQGPAALLPKDDRYALVWTARSDEAQRIAALPDAEFLAALQRHFGGRQGLFLQAAVAATVSAHLEVMCGGHPAPAGHDVLHDANDPALGYMLRALQAQMPACARGRVLHKWYGHA